MQWHMENLKLVLYRWATITCCLPKHIASQTHTIKPLIFQSTSWAMLKNLFQAIEALFRAIIYLLILLMSLSIAGLGAFTIVFLAIRIGQLFYVLFLAEKWL